MTTKWEINKAVRASGLPAAARLLMLTLSDIAEAGTAEIPERHTPSLRVLAAETGLSPATVKRHLDTLEESGWIVRTRPEIEAARRDHARTQYRLSIPHSSERAKGMAHHDNSLAHGEPSNAEGMAQDEPRHSSPRAKGMAHHEPPPYIPDHYQISTTNSSSQPATKPKKPPRQPKPSTEPERPDVERLCAHLAERIVANGCKPPTITNQWRDEARRLIDIDGRTEDQIIRCIDWATNDSFWRRNILSMPKLRAKYDQLRLAAEDERNRTQARASPGRHQTYRNPQDPSIYESAL